MSDLISKSELLEDIDYFISHTKEDSGEHYAYKQCKKLIERQPLVEPVRGKWLYDGFNGEWLCSNCKSQIALSDDRNAHPNFCPQCGADMRGEKND